jgi:uncharacterized protein (DUF58 family)
LERLSRKRQHNSLIIIISDFSGLTDKTCESVKEMAQHNDVILSLIYDPLAQEFPKFKIPLSISDGANHLDLHSYSDKLVGKIPEVLLGRLQSLNDALAKFGVPVLPISTAEDVDLQLRRLLGNGQAPVFGRNKSFLKGKR